MTRLLTLSVLLGFFTLLLPYTSSAQERGGGEVRASPNASVSQTIGTTVVSITYGRPGVKGRQVFGGLESWGEVWRTGANESTAITFSGDVTVEGETVEAGTYSLYSIPRENGNWTIILNSQLSWGTQYDASQDVIRVDVQAEEAPMREWFMIYFRNLSESSAERVLHWENVRVPFTIEA
ncbi:MAG: DUF2911 domain-containing protein [Balneolaceae bacterium]|nr:DUF2911 domain-containing protein [Balneolaceae bacterium]